MRPDGRKNDEMRPVKITSQFITTAEGPVLIACGNTRVICTASIEERVPPFLRDQKKGWVTAKYGMIPRSTHSRSMRESSAGRVGGRTHEIQRLIGRALRAVTSLELLGERTVWVDCDVIQADGGGVSQSYAIQAGREVSIIVRPDEIDDLAATRLARDIPKKIEETMQYPGQIRVTVIRETRAVDYAK